jgi:quinoprotein glucose dehydrogenase
MPALASLVGLVWLSAGVSGQIFVGTPAPKQFTGQGQPSVKNGEWPANNADLKGTRYSPLDQINGSNFDKMEVAWRFKTDSFGTFPEYKLEGTPLMVKGVLYTTAGTRRSVIALDARTGELIWAHSLREGKRSAVAPRQLSGRGVAYWTDGKGDDRVLYVTTGYRLVSLNARTGALIPSFGNGGIVDLKVGVVKGENEQIDLETGEIGVHTPPTVAKDVVIVNSAFREGATVHTHNNTKGLVRAFDVRTGKQIWRFDTIPRPGEFGNETWEEQSWAANGNVGVWTQMSVDEDLNMVYLPVETPTSDFYGGHRPGNNLFAESLVAVDLRTGQRKWHFQFVHHPLWNFDMSSTPILLDANVNGKTIKAVAVPSKQGWLYVFDRVNGQPIWPIEERPVPKGDVPGEWYAPTQPHPPDSLAYTDNVLNVPDDLIDFTPALRAQALEVIKRYKIEPSVFMPPILGHVNGIMGSIVPSTATNWPGSGADPEMRIVFAQGGNTFSARSIVEPPAGFSDIRYVSGVGGRPFVEVFGPGDCCAADSGFRSREEMQKAQPNTPGRPQVQRGEPGEGGPAFNVQGLPITKPPYGVLAAISLDQGKVIWQVPHGDTPDNVRNHPALKGINIPKTGQPGTGGVGMVVTKTLVIMGDPQITAPPGRPRGAMLRAYDKKTGQQVGAQWIPAQQSGSPMTYMVEGKQYILVPVSGGAYSGEYIAFSLPN